MTMGWVHPVDRDDAPPELKTLGRAWGALMASRGGYMSPDSTTPQWAVEVFAAFAKTHPGFDPADCMTPEWREEKRAAYAAMEADRNRVDETKEAMRATVAEIVAQKQWDKLVSMGVHESLLPKNAGGSAARLYITFNRRGIAVGINRRKKA